MVPVNRQRPILNSKGANKNSKSSPLKKSNPAIVVNTGSMEVAAAPSQQNVSRPDKISDQSLNGIGPGPKLKEHSKKQHKNGANKPAQKKRNLADGNILNDVKHEESKKAMNALH